MKVACAKCILNYQKISFFFLIYQHWQTFHKKVFQHEGGHLKIVTKKKYFYFLRNMKNPPGG